MDDRNVSFDALLGRALLEANWREYGSFGLRQRRPIFPEVSAVADAAALRSLRLDEKRACGPCGQRRCARQPACC